MVKGVSLMPTFTLAEETLSFFRACLLGVCLGLLYDALRIFRIAIRCNSIFVFVQDLLYFLFVTLCTFSFVLAFHDGKLRVFLLAGELLGAVVYFFTVSLLLMKVARIVIGFLQKVFRAVFRLITAPFRWIGKKFWAVLKRLGSFFWVKMKKIRINLQINLKKRKAMMYNKKKSDNCESERGVENGNEKTA